VEEIAHLNFFSTEPLPYGSSIASYTLLVAAIVLCAALAIRALRGEPIKARWIAATCAAGIAPFVILQLDAPLQSGFRHAARYSVPFELAFVPVAIGLAALHGRASKRLAAYWLPLAIGIAALLPFLPALRDRVHEAAHSGSVLAFSWLAEDPEYVEYNRKVFETGTRDRIRALQNLIPKGEPFIAWIDTPFYLDFARNPILDIESHSLTTGHPKLPSARYLIWQYDGYAMQDEENYEMESHYTGALDRMIAVRSIAMLHAVESMAAQGRTLYDDGERKVVQVF
jgi:hypothetical protein